MLLIRITFAVCNNNNVYNAQTKNVFVTCLYTLVQQKERVGQFHLLLFMIKMQGSM